MWEIEGRVSKGSYVYAIVPTHPHATSTGYVLEHRIIAENHLGRLLRADEVVHHLNENKKDNRSKNLRVMSKSDHTRKHQIDHGGNIGLFRCQNCKQAFETCVSKYMSKKSYYISCSDKCSRILRSKVKRDIVSRDELRSKNLIKMLTIKKIAFEIKLPRHVATGNWQAKYAIKSKRATRTKKPEIRSTCNWCSKTIVDIKLRHYCSSTCCRSKTAHDSKKPT